MTTATFEAAAMASAPYLAEPFAPVGARIEAAMSASMAAVATNANLGILLLCAPLAAAAERGRGHLRLRLDRVLDDLALEDAVGAYRAIALANPAGLGEVPEQDVAAPPTVTLREAMLLARDYDRIAAAYIDDYHEVFDLALPCLTTARLSAKSEDRAITTLHMTLLAQHPDSHLVRKFGLEAARDVQAEAHRLRPAYQPAVDDAGFARLMIFDEQLKRQGINPGTTADLVVATLFVDQLLTAERNTRTGADAHRS
jgi:triphosphoribosyl-dephospho-CoA synthase